MFSLSRYERHIDVPEIGISGQEKLFKSSVLIIGMGGLGCPAALYLAAAGFGKIGLVDDDTVSTSNLQRQILYKEADVSALKVNTAAEQLKQISSSCNLETYAYRLNESNVRSLIASYDIVIDCTDNFESRLLLNWACYIDKKPLVSASIYHHDGQISVFKSFLGNNAPCYQCLYPNLLEQSVIPNCTEGGIVGPVAGIFGTMLAAAALNECLDIGTSLSGWMMMFNTLQFDTQKVQIFKNPTCPICSEINPATPRKNIKYTEVCTI